MATLKQRKAMLEVGVNGGNISQAMRKAGYSPSAAARTDKLTQTKGWAELMEEFLPDSLLAEKHQELLKIKKIKTVSRKGEIVTRTEELDSQAVGKGLDMAYKLKGHYAPEKKEIGGIGGKDLFPVSDQDIESYVNWRLQQGLSVSTQQESTKDQPASLGAGQFDAERESGDTGISGSQVSEGTVGGLHPDTRDNQVQPDRMEHPIDFENNLGSGV